MLALCVTLACLPDEENLATSIVDHKENIGECAFVYLVHIPAE